MEYIGVIAAILFLPFLIIAVIFDNAASSSYNMVMTICVAVLVVGVAIGALCLKAR